MGYQNPPAPLYNRGVPAKRGVKLAPMRSWSLKDADEASLISLFSSGIKGILKTQRETPGKTAASPVLGFR